MNSLIEYHVKMITPFATTGIGSLPHTDPEEACRLVLETFDIPFWPQLPKLSFRESMIPQFSEGVPFIKTDEQKETIWIERNGSDALIQFSEMYSDDTQIAISEKYAKGLHTLINFIKNDRFPYLKGQVTGPLTFTLGLKDSEGKVIYFDEELREISLLVLNAKARWQIEILKPYAENVIIFVDEPILSALGSTSYLGVNPDEALRLLNELSETIKEAGGIPGIHCCSNADWPLVTKSRTKIISFDAYAYIDTISLYPEEFTQFLQEGGCLAWGIVPTSESIRDEHIETIRKRLESSLKLLSKSLPADLLRSQILLTPSCGTGSMNIDDSVKVFTLLKQLKETVS